MKPNDLDDIIIQILDSSIQSGDCSILFDSFSGEDSYLEKLDSIFLKLGEDISNFGNDLPKTDVLVSNSLQILTELIQAFGISEDLCFCLSRTVLLLIIDEKCSIINIKRAIHVLNLLLQNPSIISSIVTDESLEGSLQILGRKVPDIGDYECQALLFEALYRITCAENRDYWASIWFSDITAKTMFLNMDPLKFELNCRKALNYINRNEPEGRVFSIIANNVSFGSFQLKEPFGCEFWVDFNYDSQSISFYCSELSVNESLDDSALWETILINSTSVKSYSLEDKLAEKMREITLLLNCPCHTLITSSNITNPAFNSYEIKLSFWGILDIRRHLERIYGKDKYLDEVSLSQNRKISNLSDVIKVVGELSEVWSNEIIPQRKVSNSAPISVDTCEIEDIIPETKKTDRVERVSQSSEIIRLMSEVSNVNTENQKVHKELGESSREADDSEAVPKSQIKKVRLYNLDSAPVYDVPPFSSNQLPAEKSISNNKKSVIDEGYTDVSASTILNSKIGAKGDSGDRRNSHSSRKRSLNDTEDSDERTKDLDKQIKIYDIIPESDDDFEELPNRNFRRKKKRSAAALPVYKESSGKKRRYGPSPSCGLQPIQNRRFVRTPREAAVKAMRVNKRILDLTPEVACDKIEVLNESDNVHKSPVCISARKRRLSKIFSSLQTDTETGSSEVSWLKQKSCPLFETPKKSYSEWRKSQHRKKNLPVKIVSNVKYPIRKPYQQRRKKNARHNISVEPGIKSQSLGWSDLENFNLTVEKSTKRSYDVMKALENDLHSISTNSRKRISNKKTQSYSNQDAHDSNSDLNKNAQSKDALEENEVYEEYCEPNIDYSNIYDNKQHNNPKGKYIGNKGSNNESGCHKDLSEMKGITRKKHNVSNYIPTNDTDLQKSHINSSIPVTQASDLDELSLRRKRTESEKTLQSDNARTSELVAAMDFQDETKGKQFHLERFLKCAVKCSESCLDSSKSFNNASESNIYLGLHQSFKNKSECVNYDENVEKETESIYKGEINFPPKLGENLETMKKQNKRARKSKTNEVYVSLNGPKKQRLLPSTNFSVFKNHSDKHLLSKKSKYFKDCSLDALSLRNTVDPASDEKSSKSMNTHFGKATRKNLDCTSEELNKSERSSKKNEQHKSTDIIDDSFNSFQSKVTTVSLKEIENERKWFSEITITLSQDANILTRKLLATVQKCYCEYSAKMSFLRENIVKASETLEMPSSQNLKPYKLRSLIKSCSIIRSEVEKSLKEMEIMGKEYFEAEEKYYRKLRRKHIKASRKYMSSMQRAEKNAVQKLEGNIILKTKYFLRKFLQYINSA